VLDNEGSLGDYLFSNAFFSSSFFCSSSAACFAASIA